MESTYVGQRPCDAHYALFIGPAARSFRAEGFTVLDRRVCEMRRASVEIAVIGESHFAIVRDKTGLARCVELLACVRLEDLTVEPSAHRPVTETARQSVRENSDGVAVRAKIGVGPPRAAGQPIEDAATALLANVHVLERAFPGPCAPRTRVRIAEDALGRILLQTVHEYARSDFRVVPIVTNTTITLSEAE